MLAIEYGSENNLNELREQLTRQAALVLGGVSLVLGWIALMMNLSAFIAFGGFCLLCVSVYYLSVNHPKAARYWFVWGSIFFLLAASAYFPETWLPAVAVPIIFIHSMLVTGAGFILSLSLIGLLTGLTLAGIRDYPLVFLILLLALSSVLAWLVMRIFFTALAWAWNMQQRADQLLEVARDNQGQLSRTLKSLDLSNSLLRRTQEELIIARKQAEEAQVMKEQFVANVSHELGTPLPGIIIVKPDGYLFIVL